MTEIKNRLFEAFRTDHAVLGKGFHELAERLRDADEAGARLVAAAINRDAGPHIAFEENDFYPALLPFITSAEIDALYREHANGKKLLETVLLLTEGALDNRDLQNRLIDHVEAMEYHIADCGELFNALGGLTEDQQAILFQRMKEWQHQAPLWLDQRPVS